MLALVSLVVVVLASLIVTRVATVILVQTGLARDSARFQARSALTGVGFTTSEAESVVNHPVRRKVVMALMLIGSAGVVTAVATLMLSFVDAGGRQTLTRALVLVVALAGVFVLARSPLFDRVLSRLIEAALRRWTRLDVRDYAALLRVGGDYGVSETYVRPDGWPAGRTLADLDLREEGIRVLGIVRADGTYLGAPIGPTRVAAGETLILYGRGDDLAAFAERPAGPAGDRAHLEAVEAHRSGLGEEHGEG